MRREGEAGGMRTCRRLRRWDKLPIYWRARVLPFSVVVLIVSWGCAGLAPTPPRDWVILKTSSSTQYYSVRGTTAGAIFDDIDRNGLFDSQARPAIGLTSMDLRVEWKATEPRPGSCSPESMTITLALVVTLPRHDRLNDLSQDIKTSWQGFAARVAAHEQRHVDIYVDGSKTLKTRMEAILTKPLSCPELENAIRSIRASHQAETERAQEEFHRGDEATIQHDRKPLQVQIGINQTRLTAINSEIRDLDETLHGLKRQLDTTHVRMETVRAEMAKSGLLPSNCGIPTLCQRYNAVVAAYNALVDQHNGALSRRNDLADDHDRLVTVTNRLIEALNWTR